MGKKLRPALIISNDSFNNGPSGLLIVIPLTTKDKKIPCHVAIQPKDGGVKEPCFAMCEQIRCISVERLVKKWGQVRNPNILNQIAGWLESLLSIDSI